MPMRPRSGSALAQRHRKSWSSSSAEGALNEYTWQPCGFTPDITCLMAPSLPAASMAWKMSSSAQRSCAYSRSCSSASRATPADSHSLASSLDCSLPVSPGSKSLSRNLRPSSTRNGLANSSERLTIASPAWLGAGCRPPRTTIYCLRLSCIGVGFCRIQGLGCVMAQRMVMLAALAAALCAAGPAGAEQAAGIGPERRTIVAHKGYHKSGLYRWLFGADYRDLWTAPVSLPVLDFKVFAGGLAPVRIVGHGQSQGLALKGADGRSYTFRPLVKDPTGLLPVELRESKARDFLKDQMASGHPAGHVMVAPLLDAVGILHNAPRIVILPDDPVLGEFRKTFANLAGDIEEYTGTKGFGGSLETIDGEEMWKRLRESPAVRADSRAYLKARLVDQLIGDWDRHRNQWRWARVSGQERWQPVPEDRDQAFVRFEGFALASLRPTLPLLVKFGEDYSSLHGLTFDGWDVDKRILAELEWPAWDELSRELRGGLTDPVLECAAKAMPPEYFAKDGPRLRRGLQSRRDHLAEQASRFYRYINRA